MCLGAGLNVLVMTANSGMMPVHAPMSSEMYHQAAGTVLDEFHIMWHSGVRLDILSDWIQVRWIGTCSIGDLILWFGEWVAPYGIGAWLALCWHDRNKR